LFGLKKTLSQVKGAAPRFKRKKGKTGVWSKGGSRIKKQKKKKKNTTGRKMLQTQKSQEGKNLLACEPMVGGALKKIGPSRDPPDCASRNALNQVIPKQGSRGHVNVLKKKTGEGQTQGLLMCGERDPGPKKGKKTKNERRARTAQGGKKNR